jgi:hypothetical protein
METIIAKIYDLSNYLLLLPSAVFIFRWKYCSLALKYIGFYIILASIMSVIGSYLSSNRILFHLNPSVDIIFITLFWLNFYPKKQLKFLFIGIVLFYCGLMMFSFLSSKTENVVYNSILINCETAYVIILTNILFNKLISERKNESNLKNPIIWVLIYLLASNFYSLGLTLFANDLYQYSEKIFNFVWLGISPIFTLINCLILTYAFWITKKYFPYSYQH